MGQLKIPRPDGTIDIHEDAVISEVSDGSHTFGELYDHRDWLFVALCRAAGKHPGVRVWAAKQHAEGDMDMYPDYFLMGLEYGPAAEVISYHLPLTMWDAATQEGGAQVLERAPKWDGIEGASLPRLRALAQVMRAQQEPTSACVSVDLAAAAHVSKAPLQHVSAPLEWLDVIRKDIASRVSPEVCLSEPHFIDDGGEKRPGISITLAHSEALVDMPGRVRLQVKGHVLLHGESASDADAEASVRMGLGVVVGRLMEQQRRQSALDAEANRVSCASYTYLAGGEAPLPAAPPSPHAADMRAYEDQLGDLRNVRPIADRGLHMTHYAQWAERVCAWLPGRPGMEHTRVEVDATPIHVPAEGDTNPPLGPYLRVHVTGAHAHPEDGTGATPRSTSWRIRIDSDAAGMPDHTLARLLLGRAREEVKMLQRILTGAPRYFTLTAGGEVIESDTPPLEEGKAHARYRKRPVVVEAIHYAGATSVEEVRAFCAQGALDPQVRDYNLADGSFALTTWEGSLRVRRGEWIIRGVSGELYPCNDEVFRATYDSAH
jgi:hypothetical protein